MSGVAPDLRFKARRPCPVCGGGSDLPPGRGERCYGFLSADGRYAHCTREERAGDLPLEAGSGTFAHLLGGDCRCGTGHGGPPPVPSAANGPRPAPPLRAGDGPRPAPPAVLGPVAAEYPYHDGVAAVVGVVTRHDPKTFRPWHRDAAGVWLLGDGPTPWPPYRLPELLAADSEAWVFVVEGEKDCDRLAALGLAATTNAHGARSWRPDHACWLEGRRVAVLPDADADGERHAAAVARSLAGAAAEVRVVRLPGLPAKGDVSDWLDAGGTAEALRRLVADAPPDAAPEVPAAVPPAGVPPVPLALCRAAVGVLASAVEPERVAWLWPGRLALGKPTVLDGDPGLGKSTLTLDLAARVTTGAPMPGGAEGREPRGVVLLSAEDGAADTIRPRLEAAGADLGRVFVLQGVAAPGGEPVPVTLPAGLDGVAAAIAQVDAALLVVDPLMAYLGGDTNAHRDQDVRRALAPLAALLEAAGCAGLLVRHLNKAQGGAALYRGGGSIGIVGAARFGLLVARDPDDETARVVAPTKCNIGPEPPALRYRLASAPGTDVARVVWDAEPVRLGADALLAAGAGAGAGDDAERTALHDAADWLRDFLAAGPRPAADVLKAARPEHAERTVRRAKKALGVTSVRVGTEAHSGTEAQWRWSLPGGEPDAGQGCQDGQDCQPGESGHLGNLGSLGADRGAATTEPAAAPVPLFGAGAECPHCGAAVERPGLCHACLDERFGR